MESHLIDTICKTVYKRYPEMNGKRPAVQAYSDTQILLLFKASVTTADGRSLPRTVRVVASKDGKISKITTSR